MGGSLAWLSLVTVLLLNSACAETTVVGSTCLDGICPELPDCGGAKQQFPIHCDDETRTCTGGNHFGADPEICSSCYTLLDDFNLEFPLGPCACTYCGVQLARCVASARLEPASEGNPKRDKQCAEVVRCAWVTGCAGVDCYCGEGVSEDECFFSNAPGAGPKGPCKHAIDDSLTCDSGETRYTCLQNEYLRQDSAFARVMAVSECVSGNPITQGDQVGDPRTMFADDTIVPQCR